MSESIKKDKEVGSSSSLYSYINVKYTMEFLHRPETHNETHKQNLLHRRFTPTANQVP